VQGLIDGGENLLVEEALHHDVALHAELLGKLLDRDAFRDGNLAIDGRRLKGLILPRHRAQTTLFGFLLTPAIARSGFRGVPAAWIGRQRSRFSPQRRRRMHGASASAQACRTSGSPWSAALAWSPHARLAGSNR